METYWINLQVQQFNNLNVEVIKLAKKGPISLTFYMYYLWL